MKTLCTLLLFLATVLGRAGAQDLWQARDSGLTNNLWGVAYAAGQWVAVGEQGTILTSPDGSVWTPRASGFPTRWLVSVGFGTVNGVGLWVAVGENGLILTSPDAINWTARRTSGTRINAVAYGNGAFVAADDAGSTYYSTDGVTWSGPNYGGRSSFARGLAFGPPMFVTTGLAGINTTYDGNSSTIRVSNAPQMQGAAYGRHTYLVTGGSNTYTSRDAITWTRQPAGTAIGVQGATFFNNQFVAVGNGGGISTTFDGAVWTDRVSGTTQTLIAVAGAPESVVAVGFGGTILQAATTITPPAMVRPPAAVAEAVGGNVVFSVVASGSEPLAYQWRKDGVDLPAAHGDTLFLPGVQLTDAGNYTCAVANAAGVAVSAGATLTMLTTFPAADPVDTVFTLGASLSTGPRTVVAQPDGRIVVGGNFLLLNEGQAQFGLARINLDGSIDTTFKPGSINPNGSVNAIAVQPDGKILVGGTFTSINATACNSLVRLNSDGSLDNSFAASYPAALTINQIAVGSDGRVLVRHRSNLLRFSPDGALDSTLAYADAVQRFDLQPDGRILVADLAGANLGVVNRINSDGTSDVTFTPAVLNLGSSSIVALRTLPDGRFMVAASGSATAIGFNIQRFTALGGFDSTFTAFAQFGINGSLACVDFTADGRTWLAGGFTSLNNVSRNRLARLNADGSLDATYNPGTGPDNTPVLLAALDDGRAIVGGNFTRINGVARAQLARLNAQSFGGANGPAAVALDNYYREVRAGETMTVDASFTGSAQLTYAISTPSLSTGGFTSSSILFPPGSTQSTGVFSVTATNAVGTSVAQTFYVRVIPSAPVIVSQPVALQTNTGRPITLAVSAVGTNQGTFSYQWFKNGSAVSGATASTYVIGKSTVNDSGDFTVVVRNSLGFTTSNTVHVGVDETARIINLATRANTTSTASPLIVGFVIQGIGSKRVMIRAVGPSLEQFTVPGFLADPVLRVYNSAGSLIYTNDNWNQSNDMPGIASSPVRLGAFPLNDVSKDAAGILTLSPGAYTAVITGAPVNGVETAGIALGEIYEDDIPQLPQSTRLINLSSRGFVSPGASIMIPGFVTSTTDTRAPKKFLIRGVGPGLLQFGIADALRDPLLTVVDSKGVTVATNDNWEQNSNLQDLRAATAQLAFPLAAGSKDASLLVSLVPGQYTCLVGGAESTSGTALVEIYEVP